MRICVLIDAWEPILGGGQTHVWEISKRLVTEYNYNIDIYTRALRDNQNKLYAKNEQYFGGRLHIFRVGPATHFFNFWGRIYWLFSVLIHVIKFHRKNPYHLIHGHAYLSAFPAKIIGRILSIPTVFTVHGSLNLDRGLINFVTLAEWIILTRIHFTAQISVSQSFLKYANVNKERIFIPNGVDDAKHRKKSSKNSISTLLFVGRLEKQKGADLLIKAVEILNKNIGIDLLIAGEGREQKNLEKLTRGLKISSHVHFLGRKSKKELSYLYASSAFLVAPSRSEGLSFVLLEAMANGLPVITTRVGDNSRLIVDGKTGFLINEPDEKKLAEVIIKALHTPKIRSIGRNARNYVLSRYGWSKVVKKTSDVYQKITLNKLLNK